MVEAPLQTPRETQVSISGAGEAAVLDRSHCLCQEDMEKPQREFSMWPTPPARPLIILRTARLGPRRSHLGAAGSCWPQQNFQLRPFRGCPGQLSWPGKLLTVPILNTSVMVYGP